MTVKEAIFARRTIRKFTREKIPYETLTELVDCARVAAYPANMQPLKFAIIDDKETLKNGILYGLTVMLMCTCAMDKSIFDNIDDCAVQLLTDYYISAMTDKAKREGRGDLLNPFLVNIMRERLLKETKDALKNTKDKKESPYKLNVKPMTEEDASNLVKDLLDRFNKGAPPFPFPNDKTE